MYFATNFTRKNKTLLLKFSKMTDFQCMKEKSWIDKNPRADNELSGHYN